jgi:hypothetical protein
MIAPAGRMESTDHHSEYLTRAVAALTPAGHARVNELLEELARSAEGDAWVVQFARARQAEADLGRAGVLPTDEPRGVLSRRELDGLLTGFTTIRDQEPLDEVADWANAVLLLLEDEPRDAL